MFLRIVIQKTVKNKIVTSIKLISVQDNKSAKTAKIATIRTTDWLRILTKKLRELFRVFFWYKKSWAYKKPKLIPVTMVINMKNLALFKLPVIR
ncbi:MAG TPA: hypothetical protein VJJ81_02030 [Candidatus Babeliales bacterium]|nr:hypothetical protein [Candidatus Babeliales bacterium]